MKIRIFLLLALLIFIFTVAALGQGTQSAAAASAPQAPPSQPPPTIASIVDREITTIEKQVVDAAEAMPEGKFNFSPENFEHSRRRLQGRAHICRAGQACRRFKLLPMVPPYRR